MKDDPNVIQGSLFEEDFLRRTVGPLASSPDIALTELVANAWDAGAAQVDIQIPDVSGERIRISDDGIGMTPDEFRKRWLTLGYNRLRNQGTEVEFPPERSEWRRRAYGRNGIGRHGMLCFANQYTVQTRRDGAGAEFVVAAASGKEPFALLEERIFASDGHGTRLEAIVERSVPDPDRIRRVLAMKFLHDPQFTVIVNDSSVTLESLDGVVDQFEHETAGVRLQISVIEHSGRSRPTNAGVALWVGGRLVGQPSWILDGRALLDGRTRVGRRHTIVVRSDDLYDEVAPDWTGFRDSDTVHAVMSGLADRLEDLVRRLFSDRIRETQDAVVRRYRREIEELRPLGRREISDFVEQVVQDNPTIQPDMLSAAVKAAINLEKSRSGVALLRKISNLDERDVEGLNRLLDDWTVRDALAVLDEIDRRIAVIEALSRLSEDATADELHTLHPLVTQARWLFGPEFDSPMFASNQTLRTAVSKVFKLGSEEPTFGNSRRRPDLLILKDATVSVVGTEQMDQVSELMTLREILLIELKRGRSVIGRRDVSQAEGYVQDLLHAGLDGAPNIRAFVVGHERSDRVEEVRTIGDPARARIQVTTYSQLVRTANGRLFRLREELASRYEEMGEDELLFRARSLDPQIDLDEGRDEDYGLASGLLPH